MSIGEELSSYHVGLSAFHLFAPVDRMGPKFSLHRVTRHANCGTCSPTRPSTLRRYTPLPSLSPSLVGYPPSPHPTHIQHTAPIKSVHWIQAPNYSCAITGSWDKTLKVSSSSSWLIPKLILLFPFSSLLFLFPSLLSSFSLSSLSQLWDPRTPNPVLTLTLPERCYDMDVVRSCSVSCRMKAVIL